ncbi:MAG: hypothetical protein COC19_05630 [SAR86 cluster bacterium]|uniref:Uncharacterized protein n=1 Tax=SAR86 cluster bacterium TaxID=2030880 RepID=A0A2A4MKB2_9GAMM|nr:MAG: hypothetical protein COC19_05630 [SAR86 cluster bacterium]
MKQIFTNNIQGRSRSLLYLCLLVLLISCSAPGGRVPDTSVLEGIQETLAQASHSEVGNDLEFFEDEDLLADLLPSLSLSDDVLEPLENRFSLSMLEAKPASVFFNDLVAGTEYGVAVHPDVDVEIKITLPSVTIEEAMDLVADIYELDIARQGDFFAIRPGGLKTEYFTIDYLDVQRSGSSSIQVKSSDSSQSGNNNQNGNFNNSNNGDFSSGNFNDGSNGFNNGQNSNGNNGNNGGSQGGQISTTTETDFWSELEAALSNLIGSQGGGGSTASNSSIGGLFGGRSRTSTNLDERGKSVLVVPQTGLVVVTAYPRELERVARFIAASQESLQREVIIQVHFLEVELNKGFQSAIDFDTFGTQSHGLSGSGEFATTSDGLGSNNNVAAQLLSGLPSLDAISNPMQFSTNFTDFNAVFNILQTRGTTQIISSPTLRLMNNQSGIFQTGEDEFFQTGAGSSVVSAGQSTTTSSQSNLQSFFSGISMEITPQISKDGVVTLYIHPRISQVTEEIKNISNELVPTPKTVIRELDTIIRAASSNIIVLGGLAFESDSNGSAGLPGADRIPVLGAALEQRQQRSVKSEFIVLLKPTIANFRGNREIIEESNQRFRAINRIIDPLLDN